MCYYYIKLFIAKTHPLCLTSLNSSSAVSLLVLSSSRLSFSCFSNTTQIFFPQVSVLLLFTSDICVIHSLTSFNSCYCPHAASLPPTHLLPVTQSPLLIFFSSEHLILPNDYVFVYCLSPPVRSSKRTDFCLLCLPL